MDNIFDILIYALIIISFLSSLFRKKKKELIKKQLIQSQTHDQQKIIEGQNIQPSPSVQTQDQEYDILKEFEDFFKVGKPEADSKVQQQIESIEETEESKGKFSIVPEESFHTQTASEHTFVDPWDIKKSEIEKREKSISPIIEKKATAFERYLKKPETSATKISRKIRESMKRPSTLKEYVIISEIMGKPKAYKR